MTEEDSVFDPTLKKKKKKKKTTFDLDAAFNESGSTGDVLENLTKKIKNLKLLHQLKMTKHWI